MRVRSFLSFAILAAGIAGCSAAMQPAIAPVQQIASFASSEREASRLLSTDEPLLDSALRAPSVPVTGPGFSTAENDPAKTVPLLFVSDAGARVVDIFDFNGVQTGQITGFVSPAGIAVDSARNLYVADAGKKAVLIFKAGYEGPPTVLADPDGIPTDVGVSSTGVIAVTNRFDPKSNMFGSIGIYAKGSTTPCATLRTSLPRSYEWGAFDRDGNFYFDATGRGRDGRKELVGAVIGGCNAKSLTIYPFSIPRGSAGIVIDKNGLISVLNYLNKSIYTYGPPVRGRLPLVRTTPLIGSGGPPELLEDLALTPSDSDVWIVDGYSPDSPLSAFALEYHYPRGGAPITGIYNFFQSPVGIATTP